MTERRKSAIATGLFFIIATVAGTLNAGMVGPIIGAETYLADITENSPVVLFGALINTIMAGAVVAIAIAIHPVLKRANETAALAYVAARIVEGIILALGGIAWLLLVQLATQAGATGMAGNAAIQPMGDLLVHASVSAFSLGAEIVFGVTAIILNVVLLRHRLVPLIISIWGLAGGGLILVLGVMHILALETAALDVAFTAPIALNEMALALWLIIAGFNDDKAGAPRTP